MSIERAEELKRTWTDKFVSVQDGIPELRRFHGLVGTVRTVNMNCRLLVEFQSEADISWYDIDPAFVSMVDSPHKSAEQGQNAVESDSGTRSRQQPADSEKPATPSPVSGGSPLDQIRQQAGGGPAAVPAKTTGGQSPLDLIRSQSAGGTAAKPEPPKPQSPLETIRAQSSTGSDSATSELPGTKATLSPLEAIRLQNSGTAAPTTGNKSADGTKDASPEPTAVTQDPTSSALASPDTEEPVEAAPIPAFLTNTLGTTRSFGAQESGEFVKQIRRQAGISEDSEVPDLFQQIRAQAETGSGVPES